MAEMRVVRPQAQFHRFSLFFLTREMRKYMYNGPLDAPWDSVSLAQGLRGLVVRAAGVH